MSTAMQVLCVHPDPTTRGALVEAVAGALPDLSVEGIATPGAALERLDPAGTAAVVTAHAFPGEDETGMDLLRTVRRSAPAVPCVLYTETPPEEIDSVGDDGVVVDYLDAGVQDPAAVARLVESCIANRAHAGFPVPTEEDDRVAAVERYPLDDPDLRTALDRIAALVGNHFDATFGNVHVITGRRQESLGCAGPDDFETDRVASVCTYTILDDDVTEVPDLSQDERFADRPYVAEHGLGGYAGAPVITPEGYAIGTVCILDGDPIRLSEEARVRLRQFAAEAADQFELARLRTRVDPPGQ